MLRLINKETENVKEFYVMDAHHHLGEDEDGMEVKPIGVNNSYTFCKKVVNGDSETDGFKEELEDQPEKYGWKIPEDGLIKPHPLIESFESGEIKKRGIESYMIDQIVVFPMHDIFRDNKDLLYESSNDFISKWIKIPPHSRRLIGFGRVDPNEPIEKNIEEIERIVNECGLWGLKLHPQSDEFDLDDPEIKKILKKTCELNIPVIFHTSYGVEVKKLHDICNEIIKEFYEDGKESMIKQLKVIVGHCTYQSEDVFTALSHPCIYGELSTLGNPQKYFDMLSENVGPDRYFSESLPHLKENFNEIDKRGIKEIFGLKVTAFEWHNKIMMGTDNPYMPVSKSIDLLKALFSSDFKFDTNAIQNILSANLLRLLSPQFTSKGTSSTNIHFKSLAQQNVELLEIHPFTEPNTIGRVNTHNNLLKVKVVEENGEEKIDLLLHNKIELQGIGDSEEIVEEEKLSSLKEVKNKNPFIFEKGNPREMPIEGKKRVSFISIPQSLLS